MSDCANVRQTYRLSTVRLSVVFPVDQGRVEFEGSLAIEADERRGSWRGHPENWSRDWKMRNHDWKL